MPPKLSYPSTMGLHGEPLSDVLRTSYPIVSNYEGGGRKILGTHHCSSYVPCPSAHLMHVMHWDMSITIMARLLSQIILCSSPCHAPRHQQLHWLGPGLLKSSFFSVSMSSLTLGDISCPFIVIGLGTSLRIPPVFLARVPSKLWACCSLNSNSFALCLYLATS